ncbi:ArsR/SmtB family transcription factor [Halobacillus ihumii]|uniref:ArsR/SmtB family transcription factor n=1 Tax=Halobacillus ihumii TaxID=2686092 RepID=UPI0013D1312B|nr:metalloregulator ArsR/SmtB family transcription factor [Halobacillus ihumii]
METFSTSTKERETYQVELKQSLLWECALGIAAITNQSLIQTLDQPDDYWKGIKDSLSQEMRDHLDYVQMNNTWKTLLQLLHEKDFTTLSSFTTFINTLSDEDLRFIAIPFLGSDKQNLRYKASVGEEKAIETLKADTQKNTFFPAYIEFICNTKSATLKRHLIEVMSGWYHAVITPEEDTLHEYLKRDLEVKKKAGVNFNPEQFVEWVTNGVSYRPEPSVYKVLLIPHYIYRPWNVESDLEGVKVFYYPIANESIHPSDKYVPNQMLVQRYKALGDEVRLRIIKILGDRELSLQELTNELLMGKTTVHHHLKILKSARLVAVEKSKYCVKDQVLMSLPKELEQFLGREYRGD